MRTQLVAYKMLFTRQLNKTLAGHCSGATYATVLPSVISCSVTREIRELDADAAAIEKSIRHEQTACKIEHKGVRRLRIDGDFNGYTQCTNMCNQWRTCARIECTVMPS